VRACVPETDDRGEVMRLIQAYARANPSSAALSGIAGVGEALKVRYPLSLSRPCWRVVRSLG
jgi:hypothetical protein